MHFIFHYLNMFVIYSFIALQYVYPKYLCPVKQLSKVVSLHVSKALTGGSIG